MEPIPPFSMPIIDLSMSFASVKSLTAVTAANSGRYPVAITVSNPAFRQLFTMAGGPVSFVPAGKDPFFLYNGYPDLPTLDAGPGYLYQKVWMSDLAWLRSRLPAGVPPMIEIVYFNVDPATVRADLASRVASIPLDVLESFGKIAGTPTHAQYETQLLDKLVGGEAAMYVPGGTPVGKMASTTFTLFFTGGDTVGLSPIPFIRTMPDIDDSWTDHPLIDAMSSLPVPVDIYTEFRTWDSAANSSKPLPDATMVQLMDHHTFTADAILATETIRWGGGVAEFHLPEITAPSPDLFLQISLGAANPEPGILSDPWQSTDHHTIETSPGYYGDFLGTRLGSAIVPIQFQIGLGFWSDLISFRPPPAVQLSLKAEGRAIQAIENAYEGDKIVGKADEVIHQVSPLSLDFYGVRVEKLPDGYATPDELLSFIRTHFNDFIDTDNSNFIPTDPSWSNPNVSPVGIVLRIDFFKFYVINPDSGAIVVGQSDSKGWTISTIYDPNITPIYDFDSDLHHPLGGVRKWAFFDNLDGSYTFYTKGADRPWLEIDYDFEGVIFGGADNLWRSYQDKIATMVNAQGGIAITLPVTVERFEWNAVKPLYWKPDPNNPWLVNAKP